MTNRDISVIHHSWMLSDKNRLSAYKKSISNNVKENNIVVDIGTGTGILAAYAATKTNHKVYAIEYFNFASDLAEKIFEKSALHNVSVINKASYDVTITDAPDILITETIGQIGPEENIVEICYDFCKRHPSINHIVPSKLSIYAQIIKSKNATTYIENILQGYLSASFSDFNYQYIEKDVKDSLASLIFQGDLGDAEIISEPVCIVEYELGITSDSSFSKKLAVPSGAALSGMIHLYFEADLGNGVILSSRFDQLTHWKHSYIPIMEKKGVAAIEYVAGSNIINISWPQ